MCWPLLCVCRPFCFCFLVARRRATNQLSYPSPLISANFCKISFYILSSVTVAFWIISFSRYDISYFLQILKYCVVAKYNVGSNVLPCSLVMKILTHLKTRYSTFFKILIPWTRMVFCEKLLQRSLTSFSADEAWIFYLMNHIL